MKKTRTVRRRNRRHNKSHRHKSHRLKPCNNSSNRKSVIVENFIEMLNTIKLYHWNTHSYAQHKATDELHEKLSGHVDKFVEILLGKDESRISELNAKSNLNNFKHTASFKDQIYHYREYFIQMDKCLDPNRDTDLLNVRDEILGDLNQFLYLMTLRR